MVFISNNQSPEVLEPSKKSFDFPPAPIASQLPPILSFGLLAPSAMRCDHFNTALLQKFLIKAITVVSFIAYQTIRGVLDKTAIYRRLDQFHFMGRSALHVSGDRNTRSVCNRHDLGAFAAFCFANSKTPFFAGAKVPSMNASRMSISPRSYRSLASSSTMRLKTPWRTQFWNRLWQVWYGGYRDGKSFQGAPVRNIHKTPFRTSRASRGGRPLLSLGGVEDLIIGSIRFHCSVVMSILIILHNQDVMSRFFLNNF